MSTPDEELLALVYTYERDITLVVLCRTPEEALEYARRELLYDLDQVQSCCRPHEPEYGHLEDLRLALFTERRPEEFWALAAEYIRDFNEDWGIHLISPLWFTPPGMPQEDGA